MSKLQALSGELTEKQKGRRGLYDAALYVARHSAVPSPIFSRYSVRAAIGPMQDGRFAHAGNIEYGLCAGIHAEESAIAVYRSGWNGGAPRDIQPVLALVTAGAGGPATPCGNCRDVLLDTLGPKLEIVSRMWDGGVATISKLQDYLFDGYTPVDVEADTRVRMMLDFFTKQRRNDVASDPYSPAAPAPERRYAVRILADDGENDPKIVYGGRQVLCDYHTLYPLRDALRQLERFRTPNIGFVAVMADEALDGPPHVMYKDRQHLLEMHLQAEFRDGHHEWDPPVYLMSMDKTGRVNAWKTSVKQWLPLPFSPKNFGPEALKHITEYLRKQRQR